jgi:putative tryptophan/tyrosine transport system substrate-binding protein
MWFCTFGLIVTLAILAVPLSPKAQSPAQVPRIGWLSLGASSGNPYLLDAFRQGLRDLGWVEGQNLAIESRYAEGQPDRLADLAAEFVQLKVDVLLVSNPLAALAAKQATLELPIVIVAVGDAVGLGLVASLARPGGNLTGLSEQYADLVPKWLELLKEAVPQASRVGVLTMSTLWSVRSEPWQALQQAAKTMRVTLQRVEVREPSEFESAFAGMTQEHVEALIMLPHPILFRHRTRLVALAAERQLPTIWGPFREFAEVGGLMAYGPSLPDQFRRAAYFVDKILKGAKPADLPVEQPIKFELVINLKTAQALGITIPPTLLFQANEVIR